MWPHLGVGDGQTVHRLPGLEQLDLLDHVGLCSQDHGPLQPASSWRRKEKNNLGWTSSTSVFLHLRLQPPRPRRNRCESAASRKGLASNHPTHVNAVYIYLCNFLTLMFIYAEDKQSNMEDKETGNKHVVHVGSSMWTTWLKRTVSSSNSVNTTERDTEAEARMKKKTQFIKIW